MSAYPPSKTSSLYGPVPLSHLLIRSFVRTGGHAVDATCGNGQDTLLLADLVGPDGRVWAFDIQEEALQATAERLAGAGLAGRVHLILGSHHRLCELVPGGLSAVVFNLGYRPGGDRTVVTRPETTLAAANQALQLLRPAGIIAITVYPGHAGGEQEREALDAWSRGIDPRSCHVWRMGQPNASVEAPCLLLIQKASQNAP